MQGVGAKETRLKEHLCSRRCLLIELDVITVRYYMELEPRRSLNSFEKVAAVDCLTLCHVVGNGQ